jgi:hypothetical protein
MTENINDSSTQEQCPSKNCKRRKFDPPKADCKHLDFHATLEGKEWKLDDKTNDYHQVDSGDTRKQAFDGLLADTVSKGTASIGSREFEAYLVNGKLHLLKITEDDLPRSTKAPRK